jgi:hypothetical protein
MDKVNLEHFALGFVHNATSLLYEPLCDFDSGIRARATCVGYPIR